MLSCCLPRRFWFVPQETSLDDFRSSLKEKWEVRVGLEEKEKEAAKAAKQREMETKKQVCRCASACVALYYYCTTWHGPLIHLSLGVSTIEPRL